jgi:hypothetical protein
MRSTRATAAVARLNQRSEGPRYILVILSGSLFKLQAQTGDDEKQTSAALSLDDFVRFVNAIGPQNSPHHQKRCRLRQTVGQERNVVNPWLDADCLAPCIER